MGWRSMTSTRNGEAPQGHDRAPHHNDRAPRVRWHPMPDAAARADEAGAGIGEAARAAVAARAGFRIVLAGGSTPRTVYRKLVALSTDSRRWEVYFGDGRGVPENDPQRND